MSKYPPCRFGGVDKHHNVACCFYVQGGRKWCATCLFCICISLVIEIDGSCNPQEISRILVRNFVMCLHRYKSVSIKAQL